MADPTRSDDLHALRNLIQEAHLAVSTIDLPQGRGERAVELLASALSLCEDLIADPPAAQSHAAILGKKGGARTAERGPEYFREIGLKRRTRSGGRPKSSL